MKKALRREVVEREIDFERDPAVRDKFDPRSGSGASAVPPSQASLGQLIQKASAQLPANEEAAFYKARANYEQQQYEQDRHKRQMVELGLTTAIILLGGLVAILYLLRG
jgi:hypothetical protein